MADSAANMLLDPSAISRAESLGLMARFVVEGYMAGEHRSPFRGFSTEFTQHRQYVQGDDLRHLDWKVLGRTDRLYLKQYEQDTNYIAHVLLDGSESMKYGSGPVTKLHYGKMIAATLAYLILLQRDAVAVGIFDTKLRDYLPRSDDRSRIHAIMSTLAAFQPVKQTNISTVLHDMARQIRRKGIVILISDFFDDEQRILDGIQHLRFGGNEVIAFHTLDPFELDLPFKGLIEFEGLEGTSKLQTRPNEIRKSYIEEIEAFCTRLREGCEKNHCHYMRVNTGRRVDEVLGEYLAFRQRTSR